MIRSRARLFTLYALIAVAAGVGCAFNPAPASVPTPGPVAATPTPTPFDISPYIPIACPACAGRPTQDCPLLTAGCAPYAADLKRQAQFIDCLRRVCGLATATATLTATSSPTVTSTASLPPANPTPTVTPSPTVGGTPDLVPPPLCFVNPSNGFTPWGGPGHLDSTWWFSYGQRIPGWGGGDCGPCDRDHWTKPDGNIDPVVFKACAGYPWLTTKGTTYSFSGPAFISATKGSDKDDPTGANVVYNSDQLLIVTVCPSDDMADRGNGIVIPKRCQQPGCGCSSVQFVTP